MAEDIQLLRQYAEDHAEDAFAALVERHISFVYSAALRQLGGAVHRAEDVTQAVFVQLAQHAGSLSRRTDIVGWLYTSTRYAAANLKRTEARRQRREQEAHTMHELLSGTSTSSEWEQMRPVLDDAMHELSEPDRQAILLRFFKNEQFADVGRKLGMGEDGARMRVERALDKLHVLLAKRGITSTATALSVALTNKGVIAAPAGLAASIASAALKGAAGGGPLTAILTFMSTTKGPLAIVGTTSVIGVAILVMRLPENRAAAPERFMVAAPISVRAASRGPAATASTRAGDRPMNASLNYAPVTPKAVGDEFEKLAKELSAPGNVFFDPEYHITGKYPDGWSIRESGRWGAKENNVRFLDPEHANVWPTLYYRINSEPSRLNEAEIDSWLRDEAAKKAESRRRSGLIGYTNGEPVSRNIGDRPALSWTASFAFHSTNPMSTTPRGDSLKEYLTLIYSPNCTALFFLQASEDDMAAMRSKFEAMIKSTILP